MKTLRLHFFKIVSIVLFIALSAVSYLLVQSRQSQALSSKPNPTLTKLAKIFDLPTGEEPQITSRENGDKLIAYKQLLILYDEKANKIKNIQTFGTKPPPGPMKTLTAALRYNGNEESRAKDLKTQMEAASPNYRIVEVAKSKATYPLDVIYVVNPAKRGDAITLGQGLGGSPVVGELAPGEAPTDADIIIAFRDIP